LQYFNEQEVQVEELENDTFYNNNTETKLVDYVALAFEQALQKFQLQ